MGGRRGEDDGGCRGGRGETSTSSSIKVSKVVPVDDVEPYVMVVDDSAVNRAVVTELLRSCKYRVTAVDSGKKALKILGHEPNANMIITDYSMPEMTGYELLKKVKVRHHRSSGQIPVVIMSSENMPTRIIRCLEEGAMDFVLKPVRPSDISRIATMMLQST
ncbi:hypothetical protein EJB05_01959 [Eragrostis curvula]|uniref:Response regulatory domain-containing protein n=1 Tax=Eragrostis curvula TaxID=38414 RepID=A0A5J9WPA3_9POAL|nr:hypothetical protein EJB05_01959 [Eragrostis curvula]